MAKSKLCTDSCYRDGSVAGCQLLVRLVVLGMAARSRARSDILPNGEIVQQVWDHPGKIFLLELGRLTPPQLADGRRELARTHQGNPS